MLSTLTIVFGAFAAIFGILMALFDHMDARHENDQSHIQTWLNNKRKAIESTPFWTLPKTVINWMIQFKNVGTTITDKIRTLYDVKFFQIDLSIMIGVIVGTVVGYYLVHRWGMKITLIFLAMFCVTTFFFNPKYTKDSFFARINYRIFMLFLVFLSLILLHCILKLNTHLVSLTMLLIIPGALLFTAPFRLLESKNINKESYLCLGVSMTISFFITCFAMSVGHIVMPYHWVPQTFPMLLANVVCDGFTLVATFYILEKIANPPYLLFKIPLAMVVDLFVAGLLACTSLYIGLMFTPDKTLSLSQVFNVLLFKAPSGTHYEFGPYFWTMHTTFIPTLFYLFIMLVSWIAKLVLSIPHRILTEVETGDARPLKMSKTLCGVFAAIFTALAFFANNIPETPKEKVSTAQTASINQNGFSNNYS